MKEQLRQIKIALSLYYLFAKGNAKAQMQYWRGFLIVFNLAWIYYAVLEIFGLWIIISKFNALANWKLPEIIVLYMLTRACHQLTYTFYAYAVISYQGLIHGGGLDGYLLRPINVLIQRLFEGFALQWMFGVLIAFTFLSYSLFLIRGNLNPVSLLLIPVAIISGTLMMSGFYTLIAAFNFYFRENGIVGQIVHQLMHICSFPLDIYPGFIRNIVIVLPVAFINYYPLLIILNKWKTPAEFWMGVASPFIGILVFAASLQFLSFSQYRYISPGT